MSKLGRNALCSCGSGKKYKHCCGRAVAATDVSSSITPPATTSAREHVITTTTNSAQLPLTGLSGVAGHYVIKPIFKGADPRNDVPPGGAPGKYRIVLTLSRPGFAISSEYHFQDEAQRAGDSHLAIALPAYRNPRLPIATAIKIEVGTEFGSFEFIGHANARGFLAKLELAEVNAQSLEHAEAIAYSAVASGFSSLATYLDVPLYVSQIDVTEIATETRQFSHVMPHRETPLFQVPTNSLDADVRMYCSLYRDAANSNTAPYQFLCYYRILEGVRKRRQMRAADAVSKGRQPDRIARERIPASIEEQRAWLDALFPVPRQWDDHAIQQLFPSELHGMNVNRVVDENLRPLRDRIAHAFLDDGGAGYTADSVRDLQALHRWLPIAKCLSRAFMKAEFPNLFSSNVQPP